jgi:hypothetical protein
MNLNEPGKSIDSSSPYSAEMNEKEKNTAKNELICINLSILPTPKTPKILFDLDNGTFVLKGRCIMEDSNSFTKPIFEKLAEFTNKFQDKPLTASFEIEYLNKSFIKNLYTVFKEMEKHHKNQYHPDVVVNWYYEEGDEDMLELGEDFQSVYKIPFKFIEIEE